MAKFKTQFTASIINLPGMRQQGNQIARDSGFTDAKDIDSFRHGYVSGKVRDNWQGPKGIASAGTALARGLGIGNEIGGVLSNTVADRQSDLTNNEVGIQIAEETRRDVQQLQAKYDLSEEEANDRFETMYRDRIAQAVREGRLKQLGDDETLY